MFIGVDDTDSDRGLCTTYLASVLMERLGRLGRIEGLPKLVRLNPCAPFKTRGNAAVAFEVETERAEEVRALALETLLELSDLSGENTNPGLVAAEEVSGEMTDFYKRAVTEILEIREARAILDMEGVWYRGFKRGRGLIGALAAIGARFEDHTYELIAYRERKRWGTPREIDWGSVWRADALTYPGTWDTVDHRNKRVVFAPHSGDPVLFGIRGGDIGAINLAFETIASEPWERKVLYITNQGTDAHIMPGKILGVKENQSYRLCGLVKHRPRAIEGGHIFFTLEDAAGSITCSAFEPTKNFRDVIRRLGTGDLVEVYGAVRDGALNLEKLEVIRLAEQFVQEPPLCPSCGRRMESAGRGQGYRCRKCGLKGQRQSRILPRELEPGLYEVPPCARRHLAKPLARLKDGRSHPSR